MTDCSISDRLVQDGTKMSFLRVSMSVSQPHLKQSTSPERKEIMKGIVIALAACMLMFFGSSSAFASLDQFTGRWENIDAKTRGLTRLEISIVDSKVKVHAYGHCMPSDCDLGEVESIAYAPSVDSNLKETAQAITVSYAGGVTILIVRPVAKDRLQVEYFPRFTDKSGRTDFTATYIFARQK